GSPRPPDGGAPLQGSPVPGDPSLGRMGGDHHHFGGFHRGPPARAGSGELRRLGGDRVAAPVRAGDPPRLAERADGTTRPGLLRALGFQPARGADTPDPARASAVAHLIVQVSPTASRTRRIVPAAISRAFSADVSMTRCTSSSVSDA